MKLFYRFISLCICILSTHHIIIYGEIFNNKYEEFKAEIHEENDMPIEVAELLLKNAPEKIQLIIDCLKNPEIYANASPRKILLYGEPGTGKTALAAAIAKETGRICVVIQAPFLANQYKNSGTEKIKEIFSHIIALNQPVIVIIDELHTITENNSGSNPDKNMSAGFWLALDECQKHNNIFIIAITNYKDRMPEQLKNRFGMSRIKIEAKNTIEEKKEMIKVYLGLKKCQYNCDNNCRQEIAEKIKDGQPRQVEELINQAKLRALRRNSKNPIITREDFNKPLEEFEEYQKEYEQEKRKENELTWDQILQRGKDGAQIFGLLATSACFIGKMTGKWDCWSSSPNKPETKPAEPSNPQTQNP